MPERKIFEFTRHIGALCLQANKNVHTLSEKLGVEPMQLLDMINNHVLPTRAVISGLAKELDSDVRYLEKLAEELRKDRR